MNSGSWAAFQAAAELPDREDEPEVKYVTCACETCGWRDVFREDCLPRKRDTVEGWCDKCETHRAFRPVRYDELMKMREATDDQR